MSPTSHLRCSVPVLSYEVTLQLSEVLELCTTLLHLLYFYLLCKRTLFWKKLMYIFNERRKNFGRYAAHIRTLTRRFRNLSEYTFSSWNIRFYFNHINYCTRSSPVYDLCPCVTQYIRWDFFGINTGEAHRLWDSISWFLTSALLFYYHSLCVYGFQLTVLGIRLYICASLQLFASDPITILRRWTPILLVW